MGDHGLYTKSPALYDCLVRIPMIFRWPGVIEKNCKDNRFINSVDLMSSFLAAAGLQCPCEVQGMNVLPFLDKVNYEKEIRPYAFCEYGIPGVTYDEKRVKEEGLNDKQFTNPGNQYLAWEGNLVALSGRIHMIRNHQWKYVEEVGGTCELYDLSNDPNELQNLWEMPNFSYIQKKLEEEMSKTKSAMVK